MEAFLSLLKKEWKLSRLSMFLGFVMVMAIQVITYFISLRFEEPLVLFITVGILLFLHIFYIAIFFGISLHNETKHLQLWLHTPQRISSLVTAKLLVSIIGYWLSFTVVAIIFRISKPLTVEKFNNIDLFTPGNVIEFSILLFLSSFSLGIFILFCTALNLWLKRYIRRFQSLILAVMLIILCIITSLFEQSSIFGLCTQWISVTLPVHESISLTGKEVNIGSPSTFYLGEALYRMGKTVFLFLISCFLLDRKVEV